MSRPFYCPTRVHSKESFETTLTGLVAGRTWSLVTSEGWLKRSAVEVICRAVGKPTAIVSSVPSNPKTSDIASLGKDLPGTEVVVALGGGSVIDAAKGLTALSALGGDMAPLINHLVDGTDLPSGFDPAPMIAIPTTSGTGSEVTRWATVWGDDKVKFSLHHPALYPSDAVLDPKLCVSMPPEVTLSSGLDGLSHAMEAVWNNNSTPVSDEMAKTAIRMLRRNLDGVVASPEDVELRRQVQLASLIAGFAMGTTQTALAHSISYPFTAHFGVPHGLACSFTLPEVAAYNLSENPQRLMAIAEGLDCTVSAIPDTLARWLEGLGVGKYLARYVRPDVTDRLGDNLITRARAANNLREIDGAGARKIARNSLERYAAS